MARVGAIAVAALLALSAATTVVASTDAASTDTDTDTSTTIAPAPQNIAIYPDEIGNVMATIRYMESPWAVRDPAKPRQRIRRLPVHWLHLGQPRRLRPRLPGAPAHSRRTRRPRRGPLPRAMEQRRLHDPGDVVLPAGVSRTGPDGRRASSVGWKRLDHPRVPDSVARRVCHDLRPARTADALAWRGRRSARCPTPAEPARRRHGSHGVSRARAHHASPRPTATLWQTMPKHKQIRRSPVLTSKLLASVQRRLQQSFLASSCSQSVPPQRVSSPLSTTSQTPIDPSR